MDKSSPISHPLICISYSGKTPDIGAALKKASDLHCRSKILITGNKNTPFVQWMGEGDPLLLISKKKKEYGFVPAFSVLTASFMVVASLEDSSSEGLDPLERFGEVWGEALERSALLEETGEWERFMEHRSRAIHILGGGLSWPAASDLESKLMEGGLGPLTISDLKDFSHGRFMDSVKGRAGHILFGMGEGGSYENLLREALKKYGPLLEISTSFSGGWGALSLLCQSSLLAAKIADCQGVDLAKPEVIPEEGLGLYRWEWG